jgi:hypothetical protein
MVNGNCIIFFINKNISNLIILENTNQYLKEENSMSNPNGLFGVIGFISIIESILRMMTYIAVISVSFKGIQALNTYINS